MFDLNYTAKKIKIVYVKKGDIVIEAKLNGYPIGIPGDTIELDIPQQEKNNLRLDITRSNRDATSYIRIIHFSVDGKSYLNQFKKIKFKPHKMKHPGMDDFDNNLFLGVNGTMQFDILHKVDPLSRAKSILIKDKETRIHGKEYSYPDQRHVLTGCIPPLTKELVDCIGQSQGAYDVDVTTIRKFTEQWLSESSRISIDNIHGLEHFCLSNGVTQSIESVRSRFDDIYMPNKMYYLHGELEGKNTHDVWTSELPPQAKVMFELPSPWYTTQSILKKIQEAIQKDCYIILDLTWLPLSMKQINLDASKISEIYFSMNKAWPVRNLRPAMRWSRDKINDAQAFDTEWNCFAKLPFNIFAVLIEQFKFDYTYERYSKDADEICKVFDFGHTDVLWFKTHKDVKHTLPNHISEHYYLDEFVCIVNLLQTKGKYFW